MFGRSPTIPVDVMMGTLPQQQPKNVPAFLDDLHCSLHSAYRTVRSHIQSAHQCNKQRYDKQRPYTPFMVGDQVWLHVPVVKPGRTKKFTSQWRGPYTVMDRVNTANYRIRLIGSPAKDTVVHHNRLKLCCGTPKEATVPSSTLPSTNRLYSDVVRHYTIRTPAGGHTSSTNDSPDSATNNRPQRRCPATMAMYATSNNYL